MFYYLCRVINVTASILYPTYASYKALKSSSNGTIGQTRELERWIEYWSIMALVWIYEDWFEWSLNWFLPFYYELKTLGLVLIVLPQFNGSKHLYSTYLDPFLSSHESTIDDFLSSLSSRLRSAGLNYLNQLIRSLRQVLFSGDTTRRGSSSTNLYAPAAVGNGQGEEEEPGRVLGNLGTVRRGEEGQTVLEGIGKYAGQYGIMALVAANDYLRPFGGGGDSGNSQVQGEGGRVGGRGGNGVGREGNKFRNLKRKEELERELAALSQSNSSSTSNTEDEMEEDDDDGDEGDSFLPRSARSSKSTSSSSSTSGTKRNLTGSTLRKVRQGGARKDKRYVDSPLGGGVGGEGSGSVYEDLGSFEAREEYEIKDSPVLKPSQVKAGWFGWGGTPEGTKGKGKGKRE
ncbi:hypothetical protein JCM16303_002333 [Sporobolomyces ruberrimus]